MLAGSASPDAAIDSLVALARAAAAAGVDLVQIRERDLPGRDLERLVIRCVDATQGTGTLILVNDRMDVAITAGAGGVHLRGDSVDPARARSIAPPGFLIGRSVRTSAEARQFSVPGAADYLIFGTVFDTPSKPSGKPLAGAAGLTRAVEAATVPVLGIGGVTAETVPVVARSGAAGVAAIRMFLPEPGVSVEPDSLREVIHRVRHLFDSARGVV